jgi:hypothetical protein
MGGTGWCNCSVSTRVTVVWKAVHRHLAADIFFFVTEYGLRTVSESYLHANYIIITSSDTNMEVPNLLNRGDNLDLCELVIIL